MKYSVLLPVHKPDTHFHEALHSVCQEIYHDGELVIIDDGNDIDIAKEFQFMALPCSVKVCRLEENQGIAVALNEGLKVCQGDIVIRMDADDISIMGRLGRYLEYLEDHPDVGVVSCHVELFGGHDDRLIKMPLDDLSIKQQLLFQPSIYHGSCAFRKKEVLEHGPYPTDRPLAEDYGLWKLLAPHTKFANLNEVFYKVRQNPYSSTRQTPQVINSEHQLLRTEILNELLSSEDNLKKLFPDDLFTGKHETYLPNTLHNKEALKDYAFNLYRYALLFLKCGQQELSQKLFDLSVQFNPEPFKVKALKWIARKAPYLCTSLLLSKKLH